MTMPRYRVFLTDLVTGAFDVDAATPQEAAAVVAERGSDEGKFVGAETWSIEVCASDEHDRVVLEPHLYRWHQLGGESHG